MLNNKGPKLEPCITPQVELQSVCVQHLPSSIDLSNEHNESHTPK